jgi:F-type H+-transporting ATPase subunit alpha
VLPAVDVGRSVSRVGGKAQLPAYRAVASRLRLAYSQFEELERFARFGADVDEATRRTLRRGRRVREALQQGALETLPVCEQLAVLLAAGEGVLDEAPVEQVGATEAALRRAVRREHSELCARLERGEVLSDGDRETLLTLARRAVADATREPPDDGGALREPAGTP